MNDMEKLLHYVWQHRLYPPTPLTTDDGRRVDVIDPGLPNNNAGPDFFNAKVKVDGTLWVGNVEIHDRASDWRRHHHDTDPAYDNVVLHVCGDVDAEVSTASGRRPPQLRLDVPAAVSENFRELFAEAAYPPCYRVIPSLSPLMVHGWLNALTAERLEEKCTRIADVVRRADGDWERACFIALARGFGFGVNAEAFEQWAFTLPLHAAAKHRDDPFQVEALFFGTAGLLDEALVPPERRDDYFCRLRREYDYLRHKFSLTPMDGRRWNFLRLRPQNFPHIRLAQLVEYYAGRRADFSRLLEATDAKALKKMLTVGTTPYWETHYVFGRESAARSKTLSAAAADLLIINTIAPLRFAYGRHTLNEVRCEEAFALLEATKPEKNHITRQWELAGVRAAHAADSQALYRLRRHYCDARDCLRCRFGAAYLRMKRS